MAENLDLAVDPQGVALVHLQVAGEGPNHFSPGLAADLQGVVEEVQAREDIRGVVLTSARDDGFLHGAKLEGLLSLLAGRSADGPTVAALLAPVHALMRRIETGGKPWVAAINGSALGGGFELCLACHRRLVLDDAAAELGLPELAAGLMPGGGGTQRLPRLLGIPAALALMLQARRLSPQAALAVGLVDELLPTREALVDAARHWVLAQTGASQPWDRKGWRLPGGVGALAPHAAQSFGLGLAQVRRDGAHPAALALLEAVYEGTQLPMDRALALEAKCFAALVAPAREVAA